MRELGVGLVVFGVTVFAWLGVLSGPEPAWACGDGSNVRVAVFGYRDTDGLGVSDACRRSAIGGTVKAVALGGVLVAGGSGAAIAGQSAKTREEAFARAALAQQTYGVRSPDGVYWWDGFRWQIVPPHLRQGPPRAP